ncbi:MAG TPA: geranylgeranyl reductase family protein [Acidimicrobiales bacterium]|nr:geranylgeranyl reductase family protein [Acidimicrobiales bacterium]
MVRTARFDVLVVGAGPAGSMAARGLARGGARVALLDKAAFPRDKACGDLVGPRGLQVLDDLGLDRPSGLAVGEMVVLGPTGRRVRLPCFDGETYPGRAVAVPREGFDATLRAAALDAGAEPIAGRAGEPVVDDGRIDGFRTASGEVRADVIIGADGATSRVADAAGLVDPGRVLWGFAVRTYLEQPVDVPHIVWWEPERRRALAGYGWIFPGPDGRANAGVGVGTGSSRRAGAEAVRMLPAFMTHLRDLGLVTANGGAPRGQNRMIGGWLKMGMVGTSPGAGRVLLVGDAAGLVNPLQGEGIAQAMTSGRAAAEAVLAGPDTAARRYRDFLATAHLPYQQVTAAVHAGMVSRPRLVSAVSRALTAPGVGSALAGGWALFWNELLDGAPAGPDRAVAKFATSAGRAATGFGRTRRWFDAAYPAPPGGPTMHGRGIPGVPQNPLRGP